LQCSPNGISYSSETIASIVVTSVTTIAQDDNVSSLGPVEPETAKIVSNNKWQFESNQSFVEIGMSETSVWTKERLVGCSGDTGLRSNLCKEFIEILFVE
jgi:hypothetical protein